MKDARQDFKELLGKVEDIKEVELFVQISASLKGHFNFDTKSRRKPGSVQRAFIQVMCVFFLRDDKLRDYLVGKEGGEPTGMLLRCLR